MGAVIIPASPVASGCRHRTTSLPRPTAHVIAERLIWLRELRDHSQLHLAQLAGISRSAVNDAESGQSQITVRTLMRLALALDVDVSMILGLSEPSKELLAQDAAHRPF